MVRRINILFFILVCLFSIAISKGSAQTATASATGQVFAEVIPVFSASETSTLNFGRFAPGPQGGEIIVTPESTVSVLGTVFKGPGAHNAASFYVSGDVDAAFSVTLPSSPVILTNIDNSRTMVVGEWSSVPAPGTGTGMLQDGFQVVYVGATLKVGTLQDNPVGVYTGTYTITFDFN